MNALESRLHYPFGDRMPNPGDTQVVAAGEGSGLTPAVKWVRMALPFALDHINLWLLRDEMPGEDGQPVQGWTVVDCCIARDESKAQWETVFASQLDGLPILRVVVTHMHPDHIGLAHWLCERWNAPLWISATDYHLARIGSQSTTSFGGEGAAAFFASHGLTDPDSVAKIRARTNYYSGLVPAVPARYHRLLDGKILTIGGRVWRCISGYGHAPEHISLYCESLGVLISGDMMLPRISTNISVHDVEPESNPLQLFLDSIDRFADLPAATLVLPSHGKPFTGLHERITQLHDHHRDRLAEVLAACQTAPQSGADALKVMFKRPLDLHQTTFAMGESVAHLHKLWFDGLLRRTRDADGVYRFSAV